MTELNWKRENSVFATCVCKLSNVRPTRGGMKLTIAFVEPPEIYTYFLWKEHSSTIHIPTHPSYTLPPSHFQKAQFSGKCGHVNLQSKHTYCPRSWRPEGESTERPWSSRVSPIHQHGRVSSCNSKNEIGASGQTARVSCPSGDGHFMGIHSINCQNWVAEKKIREWKWGAANWWRYGEGVPQMPRLSPQFVSPWGHWALRQVQPCLQDPPCHPDPLTPELLHLIFPSSLWLFKPELLSCLSIPVGPPSSGAPSILGHIFLSAP